MNYRSYQDLSLGCRELMKDIPHDIDLVVGIPRSGLLVSNMVALHLNVPMTDLEGFLEKRLIQTGRRYDEELRWESIENILVVDDIVSYGNEMTRTKERLERLEDSYDIMYAAIYVSPEGSQFVDHYAEVVQRPRVFEWNVLHHPDLAEMCVELEGVLLDESISRERFIDAIEEGEHIDIRPFVVPSNTIGYIITTLPVTYESSIREWLDYYGFRFERLVLMDGNRLENDAHVGYKTRVYSSTDTKLYICSSEERSKAMSDNSRKPVLCYSTNQMFGPGIINEYKEKMRLFLTDAQDRNYLYRLFNNPVSFSIKAIYFIFSKIYWNLITAIKKVRQ